jgi:hypothetical protein
VAVVDVQENVDERTNPRSGAFIIIYILPTFAASRLARDPITSI